jgi:hypothetical protein
MNAPATDAISLGNTAAQILYLQELTRLVAVAVNRQPAEVAGSISQSISERIEGLTLTGGDAAELRKAAHQMLAKIVGGIK